MNRRTFLKLIGIGGAAACATIPLLLSRTPATVDSKLDRICCRIGKFARKRNVQPKRIIAIDQYGRLVLDANSHSAKIDGVFHLANRDGDYTTLPYRVEARCLERADKVFLYIHTSDRTHTFWATLA